MNRFYSTLAYLFRKSNSTLIYSQPWIVLKFQKIIFYLSIKFYKRWMSRHHLSEEILIDNVDKNISMRVDVSKAMGAAFYWMGFHEFNEWRYLHKFLKPEMVFLDIGSNQGEYALFASKRLTSGKVFAFEPVDTFYNKLLDNISLNKFTNVERFQIGLSDAAETVPVYMDDVDVLGENEGLASIYKSKSRERFVQNIELKTLNEVVELLSITRIDFIKIDVEGAELKVLKGGKGTIVKFKPKIMVEMSEVNFEAASYTKEDILTFFSNIQYIPFSLNKQGALQALNSIPSFTNILFVPQ
jgi:FkbM family methyltransferase